MDLLFSNISYSDYNLSDLLDTQIADFFRQNKLLNLYFDIINRILDKQTLPIDILRIEKENSLNNRLQNIRLSEMVKICQFMGSKSIQYIITKGAILSEMLYETPIYRSFGDIDIVLCNFESDCKIVLEYLKQEGYRQELGWYEIVDIDTEHIVLGERIDHHEIPCTKGINDLYCVEIKKTLSSIPSNVISYFNNHTEKIKINDFSIHTYDLTHTFIMLCSNVFMNSESRTAIYYNDSFIRDYYDLYVFIKKYASALDLNEISRYINQYGLSLRTRRVLANLITLLNFNEIIRVYNELTIFWINALMRGLSIEPPEKGVDIEDAFLEIIPTSLEIVDWDKPFIDRIFYDHTEENIISYKQHISKIDFPDISRSGDCLPVDIEICCRDNKTIICLKSKIDGDCAYKIEMLSDINSYEAMFWGYILDEDAIEASRCNVFISNAKHYERYTGTYVTLEMQDDIKCDITDLVRHSIFNDEKVIFRISVVQRITKNMYQEISSASYQYYLR